MCALCSFPLKNIGKVILAYKWHLVSGDRKGNTVTDDIVVAKVEEFEEVFVQIEPQTGEIPPGQEQIITVKYSPVEMRKISYQFHCR